VEILLQFQPSGNEEQDATAQASFYRVQASHSENLKASELSNQLSKGEAHHRGQQEGQELA
jgi:hypothetical protein